MSSVPRRKYTAQEYFEREEASPTRHEFYRGEIFAMSGGTREHGMIADSISRTLFPLIRPRGCKPYGPSQRIFIPDVELHTYPDVSVVCGDATMSGIDPNAITNPLVLVEVLSPSTERYDRGKKFELYRRIESFQEYLLVDEFEPRIECFSRSSEGLWKIDAVEGLDAVMTLPILGCTLALRDVYLDVEFASPEAGDREAE